MELPHGHILDSCQQPSSCDLFSICMCQSSWMIKKLTWRLFSFWFAKFQASVRFCICCWWATTRLCLFSGQNVLQDAEEQWRVGSCTYTFLGLCVMAGGWEKESRPCCRTVICHFWCVPWLVGALTLSSGLRADGPVYDRYKAPVILTPLEHSKYQISLGALWRV